MTLPLEISTAWVINAGLVFARAAGLVTFMPIPGMRHLPLLPKIFLALTLAVLMLPLASGFADVDLLSSPTAVWQLGGMILAEAVFGLSIGAAVALMLEALGLAAQILGFQAGYSYINMVDPTTQVDASILNVILTLLAGLLFFAFDLHLHLVRAVAASLTSVPLGQFTTRGPDAVMMIRLGSAVFQTAVRIAFPVISVLLLIDLTLGLLNQINSRLQLLTLAFPAKIIAALALLYPVLLLTPRLFYDLAAQTQQVILLLVKR